MDKETLLKDRRALGVVIARMQVPELTTSHKNLLLSCTNRHDRSVIFLGTTDLISSKNPYPFLFRQQMIRQWERVARDINLNASILPLPDNQDNKLWVYTLDSFIKALIVNGESAVLYGGRDSFIPYYKRDGGVFETVELKPEDYDSGTDQRNLAAIPLPEYSLPAAKAILWTINQLQ